MIPALGRLVGAFFPLSGRSEPAKGALIHFFDRALAASCVAPLSAINAPASLHSSLGDMFRHAPSESPRAESGGDRGASLL